MIDAERKQLESSLAPETSHELLLYFLLKLLSCVRSLEAAQNRY